MITREHRSDTQVTAGTRTGRRDRALVGVAGLVLLALAGCGGGAPPQVPAAGPGNNGAAGAGRSGDGGGLVTPGPIAAPTAAVAPAAGSAANAKPATKSNKAKTGPLNPFPGESPDNVLTVAAPAAPMQLERPVDVDQFDRATVVEGGPQSSSSSLVVAAAPVETAKPAAIKLPEGFVPVVSGGSTSDGHPRRIRCEKDGSEMAYIPAGTAIVGSDDGPVESRPAIETFLEAFYIDLAEITVSQFEAYRSDQREKKKRVPVPAVNASAAADQPVLGVAWGDAANYLRWAGKDLPTEAEFELAGRTPQGFRTPWGNGRAIWSQPRTPQTITAIARFASDQSPYGVYDLSGNAREWTADWYSPTAFEEAHAQAQQRPLRNWSGPKKAATGTQRVIKGGGADWSLWHRTGADMSAVLPDVSFRGVLRLTTATGTGSGSNPVNSPGSVPKAGDSKAKKAGF